MNISNKSWTWIFNKLKIRTETSLGFYESSDTLVQVYYLLAFILMGMSISSYGLQVKWIDLLLQEDQFTPLWPVYWMKWEIFSYEGSVNSIIFIAISSAALAVTFWRKHQFIRILAFIGILEYTSLSYSYGHLHHGYQALTVTAGMFALIPQSALKAKVNFQNRKELFAAIIGAQLFVVLGYSSSGAIKWIAVLEQWWLGVPHVLSLDGLSYQITSSMIREYHPPVLGVALRESTGVLFILLNTGALLLELFAAPIYLFRPSWQRFYGILLVGLHIMAAGIIGPEFSQHSLIVGCLLVLSPWAIEKLD